MATARTPADDADPQDESLLSDGTGEAAPSSLSWIQYIDYEPFQKVAWKVDSAGHWSQERLNLGPDKVTDFLAHFKAAGYKEISGLSPERGAVLAGGDAARDVAKYLILINLGPEPEIIRADGFPALLHALSAMAPLFAQSELPH